jgi:hypothetical protein
MISPTADGRLFPDRLDVVADAVDTARSSELADVPSVRALRGGNTHQ